MKYENANNILPPDLVNQIQKYAEEKFGEYAGIAQQYLFFYARDNLK